MNIDNKIWVPIIDYEDYYEININQEVRSKNRIIGYRKKEKILTPILGKNGYYYFSFSRNGKVKKFYLHRLMAIHFIENYDNKPQINHINGIRTDNRIDNLEWVTSSENNFHSYNELNRIPSRHLKINPPKRTKIKCNTFDIVFNSVQDAADSLGVCRTSISKVVTNKHMHVNGMVFSYC